MLIHKPAEDIDWTHSTFLAIEFNPSKNIFSFLSTFFRKAFLEIMSTTDEPTAHAIGPPPKVVPCEPTVIASAILFEVRIPPKGNPLDIPLAKHKISGTILNCS